MDLVNVMYRYINKFINSDELLKELKKIDLSKYKKEEINEINQLIINIKNIKDNTPNEIDEIEKNRISNINSIIEYLKKAKQDKNLDEEEKKKIDKQYNKLLKDKKRTRDGGKLYLSIFELMTKNSLVNKYADQMNDKELLEFITQYISVPLPPQINQEEFNHLVKIAIKEDKREALWRLAFNYNKKNIDFKMIEDFFINKRDDYYLTELISAVKEDLDINNLIKKIFDTKDKEFINNLLKRGKNIGIFNEEEIKSFNNI